MPLNNLQIKNSQARDKPYKLFDGGGLYIEVRPTGAKYWRLKYRLNGKERKLSIGTHPTVTLKEARQAREAAKRLIRDGIDPSRAKQENRTQRIELSNHSFEVVALDWFERKMLDKSDGHKARSMRLMKNDLFPTLGSLLISDITPPLLLEALRRIEARGVLDTAHRAKQVAGQVFMYAIAAGLAERNPAADLKGALQTPTRSHLSSITEPKEFGRLLIAIDGFMGTPTVIHALKLAPLLFVRPVELRHMEWAELDLEQARWVIPAEKMKMKAEHVVPLSTQAIQTIKEQQSYSVGSKYVFPSARGKSRAMSENAVRVALRTLGFTNEQMTGHGFRASARTMLDEVLHYRVEVIEMQLAHAVKDALGRAYNRTQYMDQRTEMMQAWADYLDTLRIETVGDNEVTGKFRK